MNIKKTNEQSICQISRARCSVNDTIFIDSIPELLTIKAADGASSVGMM